MLLGTDWEEEVEEGGDKVWWKRKEEKGREGSERGCGGEGWGGDDRGVERQRRQKSSAQGAVSETSLCIISIFVGSARYAGGKKKERKNILEMNK